ncbi:hypothetical protein SAMN06296386_102381 [Lachnospiraceae bacterium]|nr:hypothetical protein SAMN06296386_102381 [Lachnospiraceae bacterium]
MRNRNRFEKTAIGAVIGVMAMGMLFPANVMADDNSVSQNQSQHGMGDEDSSDRNEEREKPKDNDAPSISIRGQEADEVRGIVTISVHAEDSGTGIVSLSWQNDDICVPARIMESGDGQHSVDRKVTVEKDGDYSFFAEDGAGNRSSQSVRVTVVKRREEVKDTPQDKKADSGESLGNTTQSSPDTTDIPDKLPTVPAPEAATAPKKESAIPEKTHDKSDKTLRDAKKGTSSKDRSGKKSDKTTEKKQEKDTVSEDYVPFIAWDDSDDDQDTNDEAISFNGADRGITDRDQAENDSLERYFAEMNDQSEAASAPHADEKPISGIIVGFLIVLALASVSIFTLLKKQILSLPK